MAALAATFDPGESVCVSHTDPNEAPHRPAMAPRVAQVKES